MGEPFGMIYYPGMRAVAYLNAFRRSGVYPSRLLCMAGDFVQNPAFRFEAHCHGYDSRFFDTLAKPLDFFTDQTVPMDRIAAKEINDHRLVDYLCGSAINTWIFSGGGILRENILSLGKRFIHVHPGRLPCHRGSTTFYYSLLESGTISATAFYMRAGIDDGPVLEEATFKVNMRILPDMPNFMDAVLDPHIRALTLERLLRRGRFGHGVVNRHPSGDKNSGGSPYFIIHPLLRLACISRLNENYVSRDPEGVFMQEVVR